MRKQYNFENEEMSVDYTFEVRKGFCGRQNSYDIEIQRLQVYIPALGDWHDMTHYKDLDDKAYQLIIKQYERDQNELSR